MDKTEVSEISDVSSILAGSTFQSTFSATHSIFLIFFQFPGWCGEFTGIMREYQKPANVAGS